MASFDASVTRTWADGDYTFRLALAQMLELQDKTNAGPMELMSRIGSHRWRVQDLRETIRLGLIGGGLKPAEAVTLVQRYVDARPWEESVPVALDILVAAVAIPAGEPAPGKVAAEMETGASPPPPSTELVPSSASPPTSSAP